MCPWCFLIFPMCFVYFPWYLLYVSIFFLYFLFFPTFSYILLLSCMERNWYLRNWVTQFFWPIFAILKPGRGLEGSNCLKLRLRTRSRCSQGPVDSSNGPLWTHLGHIFHVIVQYLSIYHSSRNNPFWRLKIHWKSIKNPSKNYLSSRPQQLREGKTRIYVKQQQKLL